MTERFLRVAIRDESFLLRLTLEPPRLRVGERRIEGTSNEAWGYEGEDLVVLGKTYDFPIGDLGGATGASLSALPEGEGQAWHLDIEHGGLRFASADENGTPLLEPSASEAEAPTVKLGGPLLATLSWVLPADEGPGLEVCALLGHRGERTFMAADFDVLPRSVNPVARIQAREQLLEVVLDHRC